MRQQTCVTSGHTGEPGESSFTRRLLVWRKKLALYERKAFAIPKAFALIGNFAAHELSPGRLFMLVTMLLWPAGAARQGLSSTPAHDPRTALRAVIPGAG